MNRVEILRSTFPLYPAAEMNWVIKQEKITLAILAVADKDAQAMCDRLVKAGIKAVPTAVHDLSVLLWDQCGPVVGGPKGRPAPVGRKGRCHNM